MLRIVMMIMLIIIIIIIIIIMLRTSERITVYMYKSPELCWSVNTFSTVRGKSNNI